MTFAIAILLALAGIGLILFGLGYSAVFFAARTMFNRTLASHVADQSKVYVENAIGKIKSEFVRKQLVGRIGTMAGTAAVSIVRNELSSCVKCGLLIAGGGIACIIASFNVPWLLAMIWPK